MTAPGTSQVWIPARRSTAEDRELLACVADGDRAAFQRLYLGYHRRLARFLGRICSEPELIDEAVNDTMFTVWKKADTFRGDSSVSSWIFGIAYRRALKLVRRSGRSMPAGAAVTLEAAAGELAVQGVANAREHRDWLDHALRRLPPPQRLAVELAYVMGYSCEEIATIVDCPVNTVKTRLFHARERLRLALLELANERGRS